MGLIKQFKKDELNVSVFDTRAEMGKAAALDAAACMNKLLETKEYINVVFAAAPSQNEMLAELSKQNIDWSRVNAFHMDEYVGLDSDAPQTFKHFLKEHIFDLVPFRHVYYISEHQDKYEELLRQYPTDIVCLGIGENGHIAFNDPGEADFNDTKLLKKVTLDDVCRQQQVNDGCFPTFDDVPQYAYSLTIPALIKADHLFCVVPAATKREAVTRTVHEEISENCPATIMRRHKSVTMYCDSDSGADLL